MKFSRLLVFAILLTMLGAQELPFHRGFNLSGWIWSYDGVNNIPFYKYGKQDLEDIRSMGCDVIRLPLGLLHFSSGDPDYRYDPLFFHFLDQVIDWAEEVDMYLILDNHTQTSGSSYVPLEEELLPLWMQIAERYKDRSDRLLYEIMNEPHNVKDYEWYHTQKSVIEAIREIDSTRTIIAAPIWNSVDYLKNFIPYPYDNIIYAFHFYHHFLFTHQGASWANPSLVPLANVPFPGRNGNIPDCPPELLGTYVESSLQRYSDDGNEDDLTKKIDLAIDFADSFNVPIICDEFGVYRKNAPHNDRAYWHEVVTQYLDNHNIPWTLWGYRDSFGIMKSGSHGIFHHDLDPDMVNAMNLIMPPADTVLIHPDSSGFMIYGDNTLHNIPPRIWSDDEKYNYYHNDALHGDYCIKWRDPLHYEYIGFDFDPYRDLSLLAEQGAELSFLFKCTTPYAALCIRFIQEYSDSTETLPWRMNYTLDQDCYFDGNWQRVDIPLSNFHEAGAHLNGNYYSPDNQFNWKKVRTLNFVSEDGKYVGTNFYFDDIKIRLYGEEVAAAPAHALRGFSAGSVYPNPVNGRINLDFTLPKTQTVRIRLYNSAGKLLNTFTDQRYSPGVIRFKKDFSRYPSGIYFLQIMSANHHAVRKFVHMK